MLNQINAKSFRRKPNLIFMNHLMPNDEIYE